MFEKQLKAAGSKALAGKSPSAEDIKSILATWTPIKCSVKQLVKGLGP
jgi:hypothetical protein